MKFLNGRVILVVHLAPCVYMCLRVCDILTWEVYSLSVRGTIEMWCTSSRSSEESPCLQDYPRESRTGCEGLSCLSRCSNSSWARKWPSHSHVQEQSRTERFYLGILEKHQQTLDASIPLKLLIPSWPAWTRQRPGWIGCGWERACRTLCWHWDSVLGYRYVCCLSMNTSLQIAKRCNNPISTLCPFPFSSHLVLSATGWQLEH
jgi:hypothetical protein